MNPRWYSWQPNHGDRSNLYTKKPHRPPKFLSPESYPLGYVRSLARSFTQGAFRIISNSNDSTSSNSTSSIEGLFLPIIPHRIPKTFYSPQDTGPPVSADVKLSDLAGESTRWYAIWRALRERHQTIPDATAELGLRED